MTQELQKSPNQSLEYLFFLQFLVRILKEMGFFSVSLSISCLQPSSPQKSFFFSFCQGFLALCTINPVFLHYSDQDSCCKENAWVLVHSVQIICATTRKTLTAAEFSRYSEKILCCSASALSWLLLERFQLHFLALSPGFQPT